MWSEGRKVGAAGTAGVLQAQGGAGGRAVRTVRVMLNRVAGAGHTGLPGGHK